MSQATSIRESVALPSGARAVLSSTSSDPRPHAPGFHLFVELLAPTGKAPAGADLDLPILAVPEGISHLAPRRVPLALTSRRPRTSAFVLEPVQMGGRPRLLLLTPSGLRARLNGQVAPSVALLKVGDQLQLDVAAILHVSEYLVAGAVTPPQELVGSPCGVCRLPLTAETSVYICGGCGLPLHLEGPPKAAGDRLECALFGDCPSCGAEVRMESGHVWLPEL